MRASAKRPPAKPMIRMRPSNAMHFVGAVVGVAADRVVDHVGAAPAVTSLTASTKSWSPVDHDVRAEGAGHLTFCSPPAGRDDPGPGRLAELDRAAADAARAACTSSVSPGRRRARRCSARPPVWYVMEQAAARRRPGRRGGSALAASSRGWAKRALPIEPPMSRSPGATGHPLPTVTTSPHISTPGVNGSGGRTW